MPRRRRRRARRAGNCRRDQNIFSLDIKKVGVVSQFSVSIFHHCWPAHVPIEHCPIYFIRVSNPLYKVFKTFVLKWDPSPPNGRRFLIEGFWFLKSSVCISNTCYIFPALTVKMIWEDCRGKQSDGSFTWFESTWFYCMCLNYYHGWKFTFSYFLWNYYSMKILLARTFSHVVYQPWVKRLSL